MDHIYTISNYFDGPIEGVTSLNGLPHIYKCIFDENEDEYSKIYLLYPISNTCFDLVMEQWGIWLRWESAFKSGAAPLDSHPALPEDKKRYEELVELIEKLLNENNPDFRTLRAEFIAPEKPCPAGQWQVKWHEVNS